MYHLPRASNSSSEPLHGRAVDFALTTTTHSDDLNSVALQAMNEPVLGATDANGAAALELCTSGLPQVWVARKSSEGFLQRCLRHGVQFATRHNIDMDDDPSHRSGARPVAESLAKASSASTKEAHSDARRYDQSAQSHSRSPESPPQPGCLWWPKGCAAKSAQSAPGKSSRLSRAVLGPPPPAFRFSHHRVECRGRSAIRLP